jgi:hypothetical protein
VLEVVIGVVAGLLFVVGIAIMVGPSMPRRFRLPRRPMAKLPAPRRRAAPADLHPTTVRALSVTARLLAMLKEHGFERETAELRSAGKQLQVEETSGIHAMRQVLKHLRGVRFDDESDNRIFHGLVSQLQKVMDDRAIQLELLPKN